MNVTIVVDPLNHTPRGANAFYWGGAFGTWFWIEPTNDVIVIGMIQNLQGSIPTGATPPLRTLSPRMAHAALTDTSR